MPDVLKRFTTTPLMSTVELRGVRIKVSTNSQTLVDRLLDASASSGSEATRAPDVSWRVVVEEGADTNREFEVPCGHRLICDGLALVTLGSKGFLACDLQAHAGVCFVSESIAANEDLFASRFLPDLISLSKESFQLSVCAADWAQKEPA